MKLYRLMWLTLFCIFVTGCVSTKQVNLPTNFWQNKQQNIVVARAKAPTPGLYQQGREGVVDMMINQVVTDKFNQRIKQADLSWYPTLQQSFVKKLRSEGLHVKVLDQTIDYSNMNFVNKDPNLYADRDFASLKGNLHADELLLIRVSQYGALRDYYGFIPLGAPRAYCNIQGDLIDLSTNRLIWRKNVVVQIPAPDDWHQPPQYQTFMETLSDAVRTATARLLASFH